MNDLLTGSCVALLLVAACVEVERPAQPEPPAGNNAPPKAVAGTGGTFLLGTSVPLDGSRSFDPEGSPLTYQWRLEGAPGGASPLNDSGAATAELLVDVAGVYRVTLTVTDADGARDSDSIEIEAEGPVVNASAGPDIVGQVLEPISLVGSATVEDDSPLTYAWSVVAKPSGAEPTLMGADSLTPTLTADTVGTYQLRLVASAEAGAGSDEVTVQVSPDQLLLDYAFVDAEYSDALDRMVVVSDSPPMLRLLDAETGMEQTVALIKTPTAVSVEPGGLRAAVGYDGNVSLVDLQTMDLVVTYTVGAKVGDLFFGADNRVHSIPSAFQSVSLRTTDLATGQETSGTGILYGNTQGRLNPVRTGVAYGADRGLSPSDIERYDVASTPAALVRDSPYHGNYAMCGNLWFTDDGGTIITPCKNTFWSSDDPDVDMTYRANLGGYGWVLWADHSAATGYLVWLRENDMLNDEEFLEESVFTVEWADDEFLGSAGSLPVHYAVVGGVFERTVPRFLAHNADSSAVYVIAQAGDAYVLLRYSSAAP